MDRQATELMEMRDVLTLGEAMLRLSPPGRLRLPQAQALDIRMTGTEANTAAALCVLGLKPTWVSRLPDTALGHMVADSFRALSIDVSHVVWASPKERLGLFYMEPEAPPRAARVIYDRAGSAATRITPADLPDALFDCHRHLHVTGITVALSDSCAETVADAVARARQRGRTVSLDINYRAMLWSTDEAKQALTPLLSSLDVLFCARADAARVFGLSGSAEDMARAFGGQFGVPLVVITVGADGALALDNGVATVQPAFPIEATVERLGSGDAFAGGFLAGWLSGSVAQGLQLGAAAAALTRTIPGDMLIATRAEVEAVIAGGTNAAWR